MPTFTQGLTCRHTPALRTASPNHDDQIPSYPQDLPQSVFRVTLWRYINSCIMLGFGIMKTILVLQGDPVSNHFDIALGVIWALMYVFLRCLAHFSSRLTTGRAYWANIIELECPHILPWMLQYDIKSHLAIPSIVLVFLLVAVYSPNGESTKSSFST